MSWPQWVMLAIIALTVVSQWVNVVRDRKLTSGGATVIGLAWTAYYGLFSLLLHAGGFW